MEIDDTYGVLCTWYDAIDDSQNRYEMCTSNTAYYPINTYLCTLNTSCIVNPHCVATSTCFQPCIINVDKNFILTKECVQYILSAVQTKSVIPSDLPEKKKEQTSKHWVKCGSIILYQTERNALMNGKWLSDLHINAAQQLLKNQFECFGGLQSTLCQLKTPINNLTNAIQILHVHTNHWAVLTTIGCTKQCQARYYDSSYTALTTDTEKIVYHLMPTTTFQIEVQIMRMSKQVGSSDCGLYAIAVATALAFGIDPTATMG